MYIITSINVALKFDFTPIQVIFKCTLHTFTHMIVFIQESLIYFSSSQSCQSAMHCNDRMTVFIQNDVSYDA